MAHGQRRHFLRYVVYHVISPYQLKAMPSLRIVNTLRRIREEFFYVVPPIASGWLLYMALERLHLKYKRKVPGDYEDEN
ncbi:hypothetical protein JTB14_006359 [Gonioctena quinquepunctata]|nr:hypothetical protein JTB14_006359 [Gonioctena quinquepunctata]